VVCLGDICDFGANALRSVLPIPVLGAGRAAMFHALTLGNSFSILTDAMRLHRMKKQVAEFGLSSYCAGIGTEDPAEADVQIASGQGHPAINPAPLSVSLVLGFLGLGLTHSARTYPAPETPKPELITTLAGAL